MITQAIENLPIRYQNIIYLYKKLLNREDICKCQCHDPNKYGFFDCFVVCCDFENKKYINERGFVDLDMLEKIVLAYNKEIKEKEKLKQKKYEENLLKYTPWLNEIFGYLKSLFKRVDTLFEDKTMSMYWFIEESPNFFYFDLYEAKFGCKSKREVGILPNQRLCDIPRELKNIFDFIDNINIGYLNKYRCNTCNSIVEKIPSMVLDATEYICKSCKVVYTRYWRGEDKLYLTGG